MHSGPAYSCSWHPTVEHWIASSGRDKKIMVNISYRSSATHVWCVFPVEIQVTDIQGTRNKDIHTISALYSVARVSWRPQNRFHVTRLFCCCVDFQFVAVCAIAAHSYWTIWLQFGT